MGLSKYYFISTQREKLVWKPIKIYLYRDMPSKK